MKNKIFFVEDDENIYELIEATLAVSDYETKGFIEPLSLLEEIKTNIPDLIILDLMLPNMSGYDVIKNIKSKKNLEDISIIILSAKSSELDIVKGLDLGADDYITKPFGILEFSSRIKANLRRHSNKKDVNEIIKIRGLEINNAKHRCTLNGEVVDFVKTEKYMTKGFKSKFGDEADELFTQSIEKIMEKYEKCIEKTKKYIDFDY